TTPSPDLYTLSLHDALPICFDAHLTHFFNHRFLFCAQRMRFWIIVDLNFIAVLGDKRVQRFDQMPRRTIHHRLERGVNVFGRSRSEEHTSELQSLAYLVCRL